MNDVYLVGEVLHISDFQTTEDGRKYIRFTLSIPKKEKQNLKYIIVAMNSYAHFILNDVKIGNILWLKGELSLFNKNQPVKKINKEIILSELKILDNKTKKPKQEPFVMYVDGGNLKIIKRHKDPSRPKRQIIKMMGAVTDVNGKEFICMPNTHISTQTETEYWAVLCAFNYAKDNNKTNIIIWTDLQAIVDFKLGKPDVIDTKKVRSYRLKSAYIAEEFLINYIFKKVDSGNNPAHIAANKIVCMFKVLSKLISKYKPPRSWCKLSEFEDYESKKSVKELTTNLQDLKNQIKLLKKAKSQSNLKAIPKTLIETEIQDCENNIKWTEKVLRNRYKKPN